MSKLQPSTFFHAAEDSSEQTDRLIKAGMDHFYNLLFQQLGLVFN